MNQDNNTEVKDDLLAAFENPDMVAPVQEATPVQEVAPTPEVPQQAVEAAPVPEAAPTPEIPQQAVEAAPVQEVAPTPEMPQQAVEVAPVQEVAPTPEVAPATQPVVEEKINPTQDNPNKKNVDNTDDPHFVKKNVIFIGIIFALIILFIIFLPQIMKLFGSTI